MLEIIGNAAKSIPDIWRLDKEMIPATSGFFYFAKPFEERQVAFGWTVFSVEESERDKIVKTAAIPLPHTDIKEFDFNAVTLITFNQHTDFPRPLPTRCCMYVGDTIEDTKFNMMQEAVRVNADSTEFSGFVRDIRLFASMLSFIRQKIMVTTRWTASRPTRKRVDKTERSTPPEISVVHLRKLSRHIEKGESAPVNWKCRWIVTGHWRKQWYRSKQTHQPIFVHQYIKGPEDKPLKKPQKIFAVTR